VQDFIGEDELGTFDGWLRYQAVDPAELTPEGLEKLRDCFSEAKAQSNPKVGLMKLGLPGEHLYAVALREGSDLWLTLWVKRSKKGEYFVFNPSADRDWNPHTSYHLDGTFHMKSHGRTVHRQKRQPLAGTFRGNEPLGSYAGHGPKGVGAICDPSAFSGVVEVSPGVLGPRHGTVAVDLVAPRCEPMPLFQPVVQQSIFRDTVPWIVIRVASNSHPPAGR
jgi:hypothetical protein